jgi:hypothetical protein
METFGWYRLTGLLHQNIWIPPGGRKATGISGGFFKYRFKDWFMLILNSILRFLHSILF